MARWLVSPPRRSAALTWRAADFASVDVKGAIAIVRRGKIRFLERLRMQPLSSRFGPCQYRIRQSSGGALGGEAKVLALRSVAGLCSNGRSEQLKASLNVNTRQRVVTGRNVGSS